MIKSVEIGSQVWSSKNLDIDSFRNGDKIQHAESAAEWEKFGELGQPAWCYYGFDTERGKINGKLYNWHAVNDSRQLAPLGWSVPSDEDWNELIDFLGYETDDVMQPLQGLTEAAVRESLRQFDVSEEFIQTVMDRGHC